MRIPLSSRWLQHQPDECLLALAREGHERAFEAFLQRYRAPLLAYCRRLLTTGGSAEDALQQGFLQAWVALQRGAEVEAVKPWLYRIVRNAAVKARQTPGHDETQLSDSLQGADAPYAAVALRTEIRHALEEVAALPPLQREALVQTAIVGQSQREVAALLGVSEPAVRGLVFRARTTLRAALGAVCPLPLATWLPRLARKLDQVDVSGSGGAAIGRTLAKSGALLLTAGALITAGETARLNLPSRPRHATPTIAASASEPSARDAAKALAPIPGTSDPGASSPQLSVGARRAGGQPTAAAKVPAVSQGTGSRSASRPANNTNGGSGVAGGASSPVGVAPNSGSGASSSAGGASSSSGGASGSAGGASSSDDGAPSSADAAPNTDGSSQLESLAAPTTPSTATSADNASTDNVASSDSGTATTTTTSATTTTTTTSPEEAPTSSES